MHTTFLCKVGGSIMLTVPPAILDQLHLRPGSTIGLAITDGCLVVDPNYLPATKPRYSLAELPALSDYPQPQIQTSVSGSIHPRWAVN